MKKILAIILTLVLLLSIVPMSATMVMAATYEKAIFPAPRVYLTQIAYESYSHASHNAIDFSPGGNVFAPFTGKIVYKDARWGYVLLQSTSKVLYANGTLDYMTIGFMHDSDISNLYVGQVIQQGQDFYQAGGMGNGNPTAYGIHVDMSVFRGQVNSVSSYGRGNVFAFDAFYVNTNKTKIVYPGKVASGNSVYNGAPVNYNGLWKTTTSSNSLMSNEPTTILYPTSGSVVKFASGVGNNMYLDFASSSNNVQIYENCDNHSNPAFVKKQYFKLTHISDGWYTVINIENGKAMDIANASTNCGTNIQQYQLNKTNAQLFRFYDAGNGYCYIKSKLGCYVDVANADNKNHTNVWAYTFNGTNAQKWKIQNHYHSYTSKITTNATCTQYGKKVTSCCCGSTITTTLAKKEHSYSNAIVTKKATHTANGTKTYTCTVCKAKKVETIIIYKSSNCSLSTTKYTYNGSTKKPSVNIYDSMGNKLTYGEDYTYKRPSSSKKVGKYTIKVTFKGDYSGTKNLYYTINPPKTSVSSLTAGKKSLTVKLKKQSSQTTGYQIQYSTSKTFKSAKTKTISSYKTTSVTLKSLSAKKTYYVRVRTYKTVSGKKYYSSWSSYKYKKTK